jgi:DNA polymerase III epsilon subunit family exonuclease
MIVINSKGKRGYRHVVFDLETTGLSPRIGDRVIEIGAVAIEGKSIVGEFQSLINVSQPIHPMAQRVHGISREMLKGQPTPGEVIPKFHRFITNSILIAHNASFDVRFISNEFSLLNLDFNNVCLCTLKLGRGFFPNLKRHDLETLYCQFYKSHRILCIVHSQMRGQPPKFG